MLVEKVKKSRCFRMRSSFDEGVLRSVPFNKVAGCGLCGNDNTARD
jgi:hypothetical protein